MSIIVHKDESIDEAMKRLHGEALREDIFETLTEQRYHSKPTEARCEVRRKWKKRKRRLRAANRRKRNKGI